MTGALLAVFFLLGAVLAPPPACHAAGARTADLKALTRQLENGEIGQAGARDIQELTRLIESEPGNARAHYAMALYLEGKGFEQLALAEFEKAIALDGRLREPHYRRCKLLILLRELDAATKEIEVLKQLYRRDPEALYQLGLLLERAGRKEEARELFDMAASDRSYGLGLMLARMRLNQRRYEEALALVDKELAGNENNVAAASLRGYVLFGMKRDEEGMEAFASACEIQPCFELLADKTATLLLERRRFQEALRYALLDLTCFKERDAAASKAAKLRVIDLMKKLDKEFSGKIVSSVSGKLEKSTRCRYFHLCLGDIYDHLDLPLDAIAQYRIAVGSACPSHMSDTGSLARGLFRLGLDYETCLKDYDQALLLYERAYGLNSGDDEIRANYFRLKRRLPNRDNDIAWRFKDALLGLLNSTRKPAQPK